MAPCSRRSFPPAPATMDVFPSLAWLSFGSPLVFLMVQSTRPAVCFHDSPSVSPLSISFTTLHSAWCTSTGFTPPCITESVLDTLSDSSLLEFSVSSLCPSTLWSLFCPFLGQSKSSFPKHLHCYSASGVDLESLASVRIECWTAARNCS